jgi:hypothetical protein
MTEEVRPPVEVVSGEPIQLRPSTHAVEEDNRPWLVLTNLELGGTIQVAIGAQEADRKARDGRGIAVYLALTGPDYRYREPAPGHVDI